MRSLALTLILIPILSSRLVLAASLPASSVTGAVAIQAADADPVGKPDQPGTAFVRMSPEQVHNSLLQWLAASGVEKANASRALQLWADEQQVNAMSAEECVDRLIESFALTDSAVAELVDACRTGKTRPALQFEGPRADPFFRSHVQLWYARWLTQHRLYDDAVVLLEPMDPQQLADPASLFFYRAVCQLRLLQPKKAADDLLLLLSQTSDVPPRFRAVAEMMKQEAGLPLEGMPQVAQLMTDVQRRLDLGRSDEPVQKREHEVIAALDKLLEEMERQRQQQQQQQQNGGGGGSNQPSTTPANSGGVKGSPGEGIADHKDLTEEGAWGMLDKQQEAQARELIRTQFPPNFLDAISRYTRRLAEQKK